MEFPEFTDWQLIKLGLLAAGAFILGLLGFFRGKK